MPVHSYTLDVDTLIATTIAARAEFWQDNIFDEYPTQKKLTEMKETRDGGHRIECPLEYYATETGKALASDLETIVLAEPDPGTYAFYPWATVADGINLAKNKISDNNGKQKILDYVDFLLDNFERRIVALKSTFAWAATPAASDPNSIPSFISTVGTGTVGNIVSGTSTWWKNQFKSSGAFATVGMADIRKLYNDCSKGQNSLMPDWIVTDQSGFENFEAHMSARERLNLDSDGRKKQTVGYERLFYKRAEVVWDDDISSVSTTTDGRWYFLNTKFIKYVCEKGRWFDRGPLLQARDQLGKSMLIDSRYNMVTDGRRHLGVLSSVTYP